MDAELNVTLLRKIQKHILEQPRRLDMSTILRFERKNACGTAGCINGWAQVLSNPAILPLKHPIAHDPDYNIGCALLGITRLEAYRLFDDAAWPQSFSERYLISSTLKARAQITAKRIDHFIATKGAE